MRTASVIGTILKLQLFVIFFFTRIHIINVPLLRSICTIIRMSIIFFRNNDIILSHIYVFSISTTITIIISMSKIMITIATMIIMTTSTFLTFTLIGTHFRKCLSANMILSQFLYNSPLCFSASIVIKILFFETSHDIFIIELYGIMKSGKCFFF